MQTHTHDDEIISLEKLATELHAHGLQATVYQPPGRIPYADVCNPRASVLSERVYASTEAFWFS